MPGSKSFRETVERLDALRKIHRNCGLLGKLKREPQSVMPSSVRNCERFFMRNRCGQSKGRLRHVLGTEGWRAEWVVIRELLAPDAPTALALMRSYPEVRVHVREQEAVLPANETLGSTYSPTLAPSHFPGTRPRSLTSTSLLQSVNPDVPDPSRLARSLPFFWQVHQPAHQIVENSIGMRFGGADRPLGPLITS